MAIWSPIPVPYDWFATALSARFASRGTPACAGTAQREAGDLPAVTDAVHAGAQAGARPEIVRTERPAASLEAIAQRHQTRDAAIREDYSPGAYTITEIAHFFGMHRSTASRMARGLGGASPLVYDPMHVTRPCLPVNPVACLILKVMKKDIPPHEPKLAEELRWVGIEIKQQAEKELRFRLAAIQPSSPRRAGKHRRAGQRRRNGDH